MPRHIDYVLRTGHASYNTPEKLRGMIEFCKSVGIREVQLVPILPPIEPAFLSRAACTKRRKEMIPIVRKLNKAGIEFTICVVRTFMPNAHPEQHTGHKQARVTLKGEERTGKPCPLDKGYLSYITHMYTELARMGPTKMLIDDDFTYDNPGLANGTSTCYCPLHIAEFNGRTGRKATFESVTRACSDPRPSPLKKAYMDFKKELMLEMAGYLRDTVHAVDPQISLGLMHTSTEMSLSEGRDTRLLVETLAGDRPAVSRPGQGCYSDVQRLPLLNGLSMSAYQRHLLGRDIEQQVEIDMYPHTGGFNKSFEYGLGTQLMGNVGAAFHKINLWLFGKSDHVDANHPAAVQLKRVEKAVDAQAKVIPSDAVQRGVRVVYSEMTGIHRKHELSQGNMWGPNVPPLLGRLGIPYTYDDSQVAILTADSFPMTRREAESFLDSHDVLLEIGALERLCGLGLGGRLGLKVGARLLSNQRVGERFLKDRLNGDSAGDITGWAPARSFKLSLRKSGNWRVVSEIINRKLRAVTPGLAVSERDGRRIAVTAAELDGTTSTFWFNAWKQRQMHAVLEWLAGGALPAVVRGAPDVAPLMQENPETGEQVVTLVNVSTATARDGALLVAAKGAADKHRVSVLSNSGSWRKVRAGNIRKEGRYLRIALEGGCNVQPQGTLVIHCRRKGK